MLPLKQYQKDDDHQVRTETENARSSFEVSGDINQDNKFQVVQNPYYGDEIELDSQPLKDIKGKVDLKNAEVITVTTNIYYEM